MSLMTNARLEVKVNGQRSCNRLIPFSPSDQPPQLAHVSVPLTHDPADSCRQLVNRRFTNAKARNLPAVYACSNQARLCRDGSFVPCRSQNLLGSPIVIRFTPAWISEVRAFDPQAGFNRCFGAHDLVSHVLLVAAQTEDAVRIGVRAEIEYVASRPQLLPSRDSALDTDLPGWRIKPRRGLLPPGLKSLWWNLGDDIVDETHRPGVPLGLTGHFVITEASLSKTAPVLPGGSFCARDLKVPGNRGFLDQTRVQIHDAPLAVFPQERSRVLDDVR